MSIIDPAADHMEEVHSDCEVQALFPSTDEEPKTKGAAGTMRQKSHVISHAHLRFRLDSRGYKDTPAKLYMFLPCTKSIEIDFYFNPIV